MAGINEWLGLIGVVLGTGLGYASSTLQESIRRRHEDSRLAQSQEREDKIRLENRTFDVYIAVSTAANRVHAVAKYPALANIQFKEDKSVSVIDTAAYMGQLSLSYESFNAALSPAFLLATSESVRRSLKVLTTSTRDLMNAIEAGSSPGSDELARLLAEQRHALRATEAAMRHEFGLKLELADDEPTALAGEKP